MIFNENAMPSMIKYQAAREVEATATQALLAAMEQKLATDIISELSDRGNPGSGRESRKISIYYNLCQDHSV